MTPRLALFPRIHVNGFLTKLCCSVRGTGFSLVEQIEYALPPYLSQEESWLPNDTDG